MRFEELLERWQRGGLSHDEAAAALGVSERPIAMLAEHLARAFKPKEPSLEMSDVRRRLEHGDGLELADWLRGRKPDDETACLLAIDQFEELFTFADPAERTQFDRLLATTLADPDCPLFVVSTVRSDFLDRSDELLPRLVPVRNSRGKLWTLPLISADGLREIISGPARLAGLDVSEVEAAMVAEARDEPGALPLVQNALHWLWQQRTDDRLSGRLLVDQGGLAGILSQGADAPTPGARSAARPGPGAAVPAGQGRSGRPPAHPPADAAGRCRRRRRGRRARADAGRSPRRHARPGRRRRRSDLCG